MIERLACKLGRRDEAPNMELAQALCANMDANGIREIAEGLKSKERAVAHDCVKVLYEIGRRKPELIADYADDFLTALSSTSNRMVWGSMMALAQLAPIKPEAIFRRLSEVVAAYKTGSVIAVDNAISVLAQLCKARGDDRAAVLDLLLDHLATCRAKDIPQHAERMAVCMDADTKEAFIRALEARMGELSVSQQRRIEKLIRT